VQRPVVTRRTFSAPRAVSAAFAAALLSAAACGTTANGTSGRTPAPHTPKSTASVAANIDQNGNPVAIDTPKHPHHSATNVTYGGGIVQHAPKVFLVFWGPEWNTDSTGTIAAMQTLFRELSGTAYDHVLAQYTDSLGAAGTEPSLGGVWIDPTAPPTLASNEGGDETQTEVGNAVAANGWITSNDTQVMVMPQAGTQIDTFNTGDTSQGFCGWHDWDDTDGTAYALIPYQTDAGADIGCDTPNAPATTATAAHEWAEMATDPQGDGWSGSGDDTEIGDLCNDTADRGPSGSRVQALWSNADSACVYTTS
jgi:serine protease